MKIKAFSEVGVIVGLLLGIIIFTSFLLLIPSPLGTIKESLQGIFKGVSSSSASFEQETKQVNTNTIVWIINDYILPYSSDGSALAALSYQLAYQIGFINYQQFQNYVNSFNIPMPVTNNLHCCEIKKENCAFFLDSDRDFCLKMSGIVYDSDCKTFFRLAQVTASKLYVILDSPLPIQGEGETYYFVPREYFNFVSTSEGKAITNLDDVMNIEISYPTYYCEKNDLPSDILQIFPKMKEYYTIYRYSGNTQFAFCRPNLNLDCKA